ncbi:MAG: LamG domain-containing protein, partial [Verrucomicrobia bacterium]|nr:LamG domain-containing protein [Verrucomicrobiota bacterium]
MNLKQTLLTALALTLLLAGAKAQCTNPPPGLVGWWSGDGHFFDLVGTNHGVPQSGVGFAAGEVDQGFQFDGVNSAIFIPRSPATDVGSQAGFTIETWMQPAGNRLVMWMGWSDSEAAGYGPYSYLGAENSVSFNIVDDAHGAHWIATPAGTLVPGQWQHFAVTYHKATGEAAIYRNGQVVASQNLGSFTAATAKQIILGRQPPSWAFAGLLDELALYSRVLTGDEIASIYAAGSAGKCKPPFPAPAGMLSWWPAENSFLDRAGTNHGVPVGAVGFVAGQAGRSFSLDGLSQFVRIPNAASLNPPMSFSIEAWVFPTRSADQIIFAKWGDAGDYDNQRSYNLLLTADNAVQFAISDAANQLNSAFHVFNTPANAITLNAWSHVVGVYDQSSGTRYIYINGEKKAARTDAPITILNGTAAASLGAYLRQSTVAAAFFQGQIDEVSFYNRALSSHEIAAIHAAENAGKSTGPPVRQGLKLWFDAGDFASLTNVADGSPVTSWRDLSGADLEATPLFGVAPVYRTNSLSGRAGVDFGLSGSDSLATAISNRLNFTNCTIFVVGNRANSGTHISISAAGVMQEFCIFDKGIQHHSSPYHYIYRSHQNSPPGFYIQAALFGLKSGQLASFINGVASTAGFVFGQQSPTLDDVADYAPVARQAILGWRNSD